MTAAVAPAGVYALRDVPAFARGLDVNVGAASRPYASGSSLGPGAAMGRATFGRRSGRKWMEMYDPGADAGGDSSSSLSDTDGPVGSDSGDEAQDALRPPRHARQAAEGDDDDARIPGRWGLLTPEGSMRGGALAATPTALWNAAKSNALDAWANGTHLGPESAMQSAQLSTGAGGLPSGAAKTRSVRPTKRGGEAQGWARTQTDAEQTLLLAGAVGAGVMIVVAAWWGA
ncbi:hypothetical protein B0H13DRAFT_1988384 [Mycena leptocephala]|nr:hypothetical protein B0H13DRAFT_1988384 [Mycena leptocephala]